LLGRIRVKPKIFGAGGWLVAVGGRRAPKYPNIQNINSLNYYLLAVHSSSFGKGTPALLVGIRLPSLLTSYSIVCFVYAYVVVQIWLCT